MASAPRSKEHRRLVKFEREQCLRLSALTYLVISMTNTRIYLANSGKSDHQLGVSLAKKRANFIKVTTSLAKSVLKEFDRYKDL